MAITSPVVPSMRPTSVTWGPGRHASDESITWNNGWVSDPANKPMPIAASCTVRCAAATSPEEMLCAAK